MFPCLETLYATVRLYGKHGRGHFACVSLEDVAYLNRVEWSANHEGYAEWYFEGRTLSMHGVVAQRMDLVDHFTARRAVLIDHINRYRLDNRRSNLRRATAQQNAYNRKKGVSSTSYKGVYQNPGGRTFRLQLSVEGQHLRVGSFDTAEEAARTRDALVLNYHGPFASLTFPGTLPMDIETARREAQNRRAKRIQEDAAANRSRKRRAMPESIYVGVGLGDEESSLPWEAYFADGGKDATLLGQFPTAEDAARAVDEARAERSLPKVNFPDCKRQKDDLFNLEPLEVLCCPGCGAHTVERTTARYAGAHRVRNRCWITRYKSEYVARFRTEIEAAQEYDNARRRDGLNAVNFPKGIRTELSHRAEMCQTCETQTANTAKAGFLGITFHKGRRKWMARAGKEGYLGVFDTAEEAAKAVDDARREQGRAPVNFPLGTIG